MLITYVRDGGVAAFPGLARPVEIDTAHHRDRELEALVRAARREHVAAPTAPATRDGFTYRITVRDGAGQTELVYHDPIDSPAGRRLVDALEARRTRS